MDFSQKRIWRGRQDRTARNCLALRAYPSVPGTGEREQLTVVHLKTIALLCLAFPLPLVEAACRNEASLQLERFAERGSRGDGLRSSVDRFVPDPRIFGPGWYKPPDGLADILADGYYRLRRRDVVTGIPLAFFGNRPEILLDKLLSPPQSVSSSHDSPYRKLPPDAPFPQPLHLA